MPVAIVYSLLEELSNDYAQLAVSYTNRAWAQSIFA
jgi:hypothetical protein